ncbi:MAG: SLC13/DASS family transporter, partial [Acidobacteria bacterium]|nr:SLC13/DASS family transporter [Acidobacteriota bacterium]
RARVLHARLGPMTRNEVLALAVVLSAVAALALRSTFPALYMLDRTAILLLTTPLFFILRVLTIQDLEEIPWNIVLLFGGAMSIGICLWETGAASWLAVLCLELGRNAHGVAFVLLLGIFVLALTNIVMNVAVIALLLPVALVMARYLAAAPEVVFYVMLATAGMPFMLLLGAAPNAIAFGSRQFTPGEFFRTGVPASLLLMAVLGLFVWLIWPLMGMPR